MAHERQPTARRRPDGCNSKPHRGRKPLSKVASGYPACFSTHFRNEPECWKRPGQKVVMPEPSTEARIERSDRRVSNLGYDFQQTDENGPTRTRAEPFPRASQP
jgi:hypothetical protein